MSIKLHRANFNQMLRLYFLCVQWTVIISTYLTELAVHRTFCNQSAPDRLWPNAIDNRAWCVSKSLASTLPFHLDREHILYDVLSSRWGVLLCFCVWWSDVVFAVTRHKRSNISFVYLQTIKGLSRCTFRPVLGNRATTTSDHILRDTMKMCVTRW